MEALKTVAHEAQTADIKDVVKDTGLGVARIYDTVDRSTTAIGMSIELLNDRMNTLELHSSRKYRRPYDIVAKLKNSKECLDLRQ